MITCMDAIDNPHLNAKEIVALSGNTFGSNLKLNGCCFPTEKGCEKVVDVIEYKERAGVADHVPKHGMIISIFARMEMAVEVDKNIKAD